MPHKKKILLVGGGTGGHVRPVFELYNRLKKRDCLDVAVVGGTGPIEQEFFAGNPDFFSLTTGKVHRNFTAKNIAELAKLLFGIPRAYSLLKKVGPELIFSKGGYVSIPIIFWARRLKIPYFIHESDIEMGYSNKVAAKNAKKVFVGFPVEEYSSSEKSNFVYSGQFLPDKHGLEKTKLFPNADPAVFITGGSQGATAINEAVFGGLDRLLGKYNVIHQTGNLGLEKANNLRDALDPVMRDRYLPRVFFGHSGKESIGNAFTNCDIFVGRASITTPAEATYYQKPMILIPYPHAAADHQMKNALFLKKNGAAIVIPQDDLTPEKLQQEIDGLLEDSKKRDALISNAQKIFSTNATEVIANEILKQIKCEEV